MLSVLFLFLGVWFSHSHMYACGVCSCRLINSLLNMFSCQFLQLLRVTMALHVLPHICSNVYDIISLLFHPFQLTKATIMALSSTSEHNKKHWPKRLQEQCGLVFLFTACYCWLAHCCRSLWKVEKLKSWPIEIGIGKAMAKWNRNVLTIQRVVVLASNKWRWQCKFNSSLNVRTIASQQKQQTHLQWCEIRIGIRLVVWHFFSAFYTQQRVNLRICNSTCFPCLGVVSAVFSFVIVVIAILFTCADIFCSPFLCWAVCLQSFTYQNQ